MALLSLYSCKKKKVEPTVKDLLTAHIWIGENTKIAVTAFSFPVFSDTLQTDSTAIEFKKDDTFILYSRTPSNGNLTEISRQGYTLSPDNKTLTLSSTDGLLGGFLQIVADSFNIQIPRSIGIEKISTEQLILKGQFQQNIRAGDIPFSLPTPAPLPPNTQIPLIFNYELSFRK
ncbi:MAG: hypothetical protein OHK0045_03700 [Raineya sp.]